MTKAYSGGCACGAIRYEIAGEPIFENHCQCLDCQKQSGTGHGSYMSFSPDADMHITGKMAIWGVTADSEHEKFNSFCPTCGTLVHLTFAAMPGLVAIAVASLDDPSQFKPQALTYSIRGHAWDMIDPALHAFEKGASA